MPSSKFAGSTSVFLFILWKCYILGLYCEVQDILYVKALRSLRAQHEGLHCSDPTAGHPLMIILTL